MAKPFSPRIFTPLDMQVQSWQLRDQILTIAVRCKHRGAACPGCGISSTRVHGAYERQIHDLPCHGYRVRLHATVRRFRCANPACDRQTFAEALSVAMQYQRRSQRLQKVHAQVGLALGGLPSARLLCHLGMQVSGDTILRTLIRTMASFEASHPAESPDKIGIDDWAYRRGHRYGTIVVDLERRRPIALLPDRDTSTVAAWLAQQSELRVVTRDRAGAYAEAIREGAPGAMQVADRWHLLKNLGDAMERLLTRHQQALRDSARRLAGEGTDPTTNSALAKVNTGMMTPAVKDGSLSLERRARRLARYEEVARQHQHGMSIRTIAKTQQLDRRTVRGWLHAGSFPERAQRVPVPGKLTPYCSYLQERWNAGCRNGALLLREITSRGYRGRASILRRLLAGWRQATPSPALPSRGSVPSPRCLVAWLLGWKYRASYDMDYRSRFVETLCCSYPQIRTAQRLANDFVAMLKKRARSALAGWLQQARASGVREMRGFANGLERDFDAVQAAVETPYSNGIVEGHINRLKMLKRQMYGRASLALLRIRVLYGQRAVLTVT
ncbi:MAG: ISL3 family transposase [Chloroflexota bacterium]